MSTKQVAYVVGIDASTVSVAFVARPLIPDAGPTIVEKDGLESGQERPLYALRSARGFMRLVQSTPGHEIVLVAIESPLMNRMNVQVTIKQSIVNGAVQAGVASVVGSSIILLQPSSWKKEALGFGAYDKNQIRARVAEEWPEAVELVGKDQDLNDAWGLAEAGRNLHKRAERITG